LSEITTLPGEPDQTCVNCKFWFEFGDETGFCRRRAPVRNPSANDIEDCVTASWPLTDSGWWCGEWGFRMHGEYFPEEQAPFDSGPKQENTAGNCS
jgi:hypothetical protein